MQLLKDYMQNQLVKESHYSHAWLHLVT